MEVMNYLSNPYKLRTIHILNNYFSNMHYINYDKLT